MTMSHLLISGGTRGIGKACVKLFADQGFKVSSLSRLGKPEDAIKGVSYYKCDVRNPSDVNRAVKASIKKNGEIDVLISNAGISVVGLAQYIEFDVYRNVMDTNFGGLFNLTNAVIPHMVNQQHGVILAVSSMWGQIGASCEALYSASKGAIDAYIKSLAKELGPSGIRVNAVSPGVIDTDMMSVYTTEDKKVLCEETPAGRLGYPVEVAETLYFLQSEKASFITGQIIGVNGGFLI
ncbi:MAG: SDR family oxidoreductase [Clostridiales bacterium]|nr:SDR family oxidoreductase [Clostridiales bacterium]